MIKPKQSRSIIINLWTAFNTGIVTWVYILYNSVLNKKDAGFRGKCQEVFRRFCRFSMRRCKRHGGWLGGVTQDSYTSMAQKGGQKAAVRNVNNSRQNNCPQGIRNPRRSPFAGPWPLECGFIWKLRIWYWLNFFFALVYVLITVLQYYSITEFKKKVCLKQPFLIQILFSFWCSRIK